MKIRANREAFYDEHIIKVGEVVNFKGDKLPTWATLADGKQQKKQEESENKQTENIQENKGIFSGLLDKFKGNDPVQENATDDENENNMAKMGELDALITEGIEYNILIDSEGKTIQEQIDELKLKIEEAKKNK